MLLPAHSKQSYKQTRAVAAVDTYTLKEGLKGLRGGIKKERLDVGWQSPFPDVQGSGAVQRAI